VSKRINYYEFPNQQPDLESLRERFRRSVSRFSDLHPKFIDMSHACPGGGDFGICDRVARQVGSPAVGDKGFRLLHDLDLLVTSLPRVPKIYLVSDMILTSTLTPSF
jgi:hypothetical protein